jgi:hypothetical protein
VAQLLVRYRERHNRLEAALAELLPFLAERLAAGRGAGHRLAWLAPEGRAREAT